jgi:hypothetical protein
MPTPRRRWTALASAAVLCFTSAGVYAAQDAPKDRPQEQQAAGTLTASYDSLAKEYQAAQQNFSTAYQAAKDDAERQKIVEEKYPRPEKFAGRFADFAEKNPDDPKALDALVWIVQYVRTGPDFTRALGQLEQHIKSERIAQIAPSLVYSGDDSAVTFLQKAADQSPHRSVKGAAVYALGDWHMNRNNQAEAERRFEEVIEKYGDLKHYRGTLADAAKAQLHEIRDLAVGKPAPEIEGEDVDGKKFKLSEYRGKVVVLDFWGDW